jgi:hypothetical protein
MTVEAWGGGGGGGGAGGTRRLGNNSMGVGGGGGGGGGYATYNFGTVSGGMTLSYTVGGGGAKGNNGYSTSNTCAKPWGMTYAGTVGFKGFDSTVNFDGETITAIGGNGGGGGRYVCQSLNEDSTYDVGVGGAGGGYSMPAGGSGANGSKGGNGISSGVAVSSTISGGAGGAGAGGSAGYGGGGGSILPSSNTTGGPYVGSVGLVKITFIYPYDVTLSSVSPSAGGAGGGTTLTIIGTDLTGTTAVTVGGVNCQSFAVIDNETVECVTPAGTMGATVDVAVTSYGVTETVVGAFRYETQPVISSVSVGGSMPVSPTVRYMSEDAGVTGIIVFDILGVGLTDVKQLMMESDGIVTVISVNNAAEGDYRCSSSNDTVIHCSVNTASGDLATAGVYDVSVAYGSGVSSNVLTEALELINVSMTPRAGLVYGGETIVMSGDGLGTWALAATNSYGVRVQDDGWVALSCSVVGTDEIHCTMPAHAAGNSAVWLMIYTGAYYDYIMWGYEYKEATISLAVTPNDVSFVVIPGSNGSSGYTIATVETDNPGGYSLSLESNGAELVCEDNGSYTIPSIASDGGLTIAGGNHGAWGWNVVAPAAAGGVWALGVPDVPTTWRTIPFGASATMANASTPSTIDGDKYGLYFGAIADNGQASCHYKQVLIITAVPNT